MAALTQGRPAPQLNLNAFDGSEINLQDMKGTPVLLNFFKSTCPWCQQEMPRLAKVYARLAEQGLDVNVIGIVVGTDTQSSAEQFAQSYGLKIPLAIDSEKIARTAFGIERVPTMVLVDAKGIVSRVYEGATEQLGGIVEQTIMAAARGDGPPNYDMIGNGCAPD